MADMTHSTEEAGRSERRKALEAEGVHFVGLRERLSMNPDTRPPEGREAAANSDFRGLTLRQSLEAAGRTWNRGRCRICKREYALVPSTGLVRRHNQLLYGVRCAGSNRAPILEER